MNNSAPFHSKHRKDTRFFRFLFNFPPWDLDLKFFSESTENVENVKNCSKENSGAAILTLS